MATRYATRIARLYPYAFERRSELRRRRHVLELNRARQQYAYYFLFFFNDTATTEIYTLSLHDALPIYEVGPDAPADEQQGERIEQRPDTVSRLLGDQIHGPRKLAAGGPSLNRAGTWRGHVETARAPAPRRATRPPGRG